AGLAVVEALALTGIFLAMVVTVAVSAVFVPLVLLPPVATALVGTTLLVPAAALARQSAPLDQHVVLGGEAQVGPCQRNQRNTGPNHFAQRGAAVHEGSQRSRPVVKAAIVHLWPLTPSLLSTSRCASW